MEVARGNFLWRNIANIVSILGVLPLALLFLDDGFRYLLPLIVYNNFMDDLDGILAAKLNIRSRFGANLDNVCDAVAHVAIALAVGAHFGGWVMIASAIAAGSMILRVTSRVDPDGNNGNGSPTNELMRHLLLVLLLAQVFGFEPEFYLMFIFLLHAVSLVAPYKMSGLLRGQAHTVMAVVFVNIALIVAWLVPVVSPVVAVAFAATYFYAFVRGGSHWLRDRNTQ